MCIHTLSRRIFSCNHVLCAKRATHRDLYSDTCRKRIFNTRIKSSGCRMTARLNRALTADATWSIKFSRRRANLILPLPVYRIPTWNFPEFFKWSYILNGTSLFSRKKRKSRINVTIRRPMYHSALFGYKTNALSHILRFKYGRTLFTLFSPFITIDIYAIFKTISIQMIGIFKYVHCIWIWHLHVFVLYICIFT